MLRRIFRCAFAAAVTFAACAAVAQVAHDPKVNFDPIGKITRINTFDRSQRVELGAAANGKPTCYFREQGSRYTLDIGMTALGAFIRLDTVDQRELTPKEPLRLFAGKQIPPGEYAAGLFEELRVYNGEFAFFIPKPDRDGFVVIANGDPRAFLQMVAAARDQYVVVQSTLNPKNVNFVAVYAFPASAIGPIMECARG